MKGGKGQYVSRATIILLTILLIIIIMRGGGEGINLGDRERQSPGNGDRNEEYQTINNSKYVYVRIWNLQ